jgi:hypothetical protein
MKVVKEEELVLRGLRLNLKKGVEPEPPQKNYADRKPDQRSIKEMHEAIRGIEGTIGDMKESLKDKLFERKEELWRLLDQNL